MKIVHVCLNGPVTDGWSYQDNLLPKYHRLLGHEVTILTSQWVFNTKGSVVQFSKTDYFNDDGVFVIRIPYARGRWNSKLKKSRGLYGRLSQLKPDVIFLHDFQSLDSLKVYKYARKHPTVRLYADNHADFTNSATNSISKWLLHGLLWRHVAKKLNKVCRKFYGVLPARVDFLTDIYKLPENKCELLLMGADDELVDRCSAKETIEKTKQKYEIQPGTFLIATGGKIDRWKRETLALMKALKRIKDPRVQLVVFGSVEEEIKEDFDALVDGKKVRYLGWLSSQEIYALFAACDLVVFPGRHSVLWEQCVGQGVPLICRDHPGTKHVDVGGNVLFLERSDEEEIHQKLMEVLSSPEAYSKMLSVSQTEGKNIFSYLRIAKESIEV